MPRVPLLSGTRLVIADAPDALVLQPPPPGEAIADVAAAVRDALRFPLDGPPLATLASRASRATIVVEPPALPIPGSPADPRQLAVGAVVAELERHGIASGYQTILLTAGLARRTSQRELVSLVPPELARRFHGRVVVHDVEDPELLVTVDETTRPPLRVNRVLAETDLIVVVSAAETVLHGGPATLLAATDANAQRAAGAYSLLETTASQGWHLALAVERALAPRVPLIGVSLVLNHPDVSGALRGYPYDLGALERITRSPLRHAFGLLPDALRGTLIRAIPTTLTAGAAFAGPPSIAHTEALLRAVELRRAILDEPLDALVVGLPGVTPYLPRERPNPLLAAFLGLGLALRLWRDAFPVVDGGTVVLVNRFARHFAHPTQQPYRTFFHTLRTGDPQLLVQAERAAAVDARAIEEYRAGRTVHPILPFRDWNACQPAIGRLGTVLAAGAMDAAIVRQLGFVPVQGVGTALEMVRAQGATRIGFLLSPPYFPLRVGTT